MFYIQYVMEDFVYGGRGVIIEKVMICPVEELDGMEVDILILQVDTLKDQDGSLHPQAIWFSVCLRKPDGKLA